MSHSDPKEKKRSLSSRSRGVACVATLTAAGLSFGLIACGGSEGSATADQPAAQTTAQAAGDSEQSNGTTPPGGMPGPPAELTAKQEKCVTSQGVDLPDRSAGGPDSGDPASMPDPQEMQAAFAACDIEMPDPPGGAGPSMP